MTKIDTLTTIIIVRMILNYGTHAADNKKSTIKKLECNTFCSSIINMMANVVPKNNKQKIAGKK